MKMFNEIKRVISQFFETEWFYRWRKIEHHSWGTGNHTVYTERALSHLNNTWDGDISLINILNDKIFHMYINLRKYGDTTPRYLTIGDVFAYGSYDDKYWFLFKALDECIVEESKIKINNKNFIQSIQRICIGENHDTEMDYYLAKKTLINKKTRETSVTYSIQEQSYKDLIIFNEKPTHLSAIRDTAETELGIKIKMDDLFNYIHTVNVVPEDYKIISDKLKECIIGRIPSLHSLWEFRKMINKLSNMDEYDEPYNMEFEKAMSENDSLKKKELYHKAREHFINDKKKYARKIADFWCEKSESWWD